MLSCTHTAYCNYAVNLCSQEGYGGAGHAYLCLDDCVTTRERVLGTSTSVQSVAQLPLMPC